MGPWNVCFELWCWRRLLSVTWTSRRSNQSILKEMRPDIHWKDWCWSWNSNTLAIWCWEQTYWKRPCYWERLRAGGEGDYRGWDGWTVSPTQWTWVCASSGGWWRTGSLASCSPWGHELDTTEQLDNSKISAKGSSSRSWGECLTNGALTNLATGASWWPSGWDFAFQF